MKKKYLHCGKECIHSPDFIVPAHTREALHDRPTSAGQDADKKPFKKYLPKLQKQTREFCERLYAQKEKSLLIVLQAMDAAGKDSTIRRCFGHINPQRCRTVGFKKPTSKENRHDYLWRIHREVPEAGTITIFNRSHYESVLVEKIHKLEKKEKIASRYDSINDFERMLVQEDTVLIKIFLHISKEYQKERLLRRLRRDDKRWKFSTQDVKERALWDEYFHAYESMFFHCSPPETPWYIIPAERRWYRDMVITTIVLEHLRRIDPQFPQVDIREKDVDLT